MERAYMNAQWEKVLAAMPDKLSSILQGCVVDWCPQAVLWPPWVPTWWKDALKSVSEPHKDIMAHMYMSTHAHTE